MEYNNREVGDIINRFNSICPRCGDKSEVIKTTLFFITECKSCGFNMGQPR